MQVRNVLIDTHAGYANKPTFIVVVDKFPVEPEKILFEQRSGLFFGYDVDGYVKFYSYSQPGNGYGGSTFNVIMKDGEEKDLIGPWSSRAGVMNKAGFPESVDVVFREIGSERTIHGHILADVLIEYADMKRVETEDGEYTFEPTLSKGDASV